MREEVLKIETKQAKKPAQRYKDYLQRNLLLGRTRKEFMLTDEERGLMQDHLDGLRKVAA